VALGTHVNHSINDADEKDLQLGGILASPMEAVKYKPETRDSINRDMLKHYAHARSLEPDLARANRVAKSYHNWRDVLLIAGFATLRKGFRPSERVHIPDNECNAADRASAGQPRQHNTPIRRNNENPSGPASHVIVESIHKFGFTNTGHERPDQSTAKRHKLTVFIHRNNLLVRDRRFARNRFSIAFQFAVCFLLFVVTRPRRNGTDITAAIRIRRCGSCVQRPRSCAKFAFGSSMLRR
jgi:hypothetical protein